MNLGMVKQNSPGNMVVVRAEAEDWPSFLFRLGSKASIL
jgi:hypothetical protein